MNLRIYNSWYLLEDFDNIDIIRKYQIKNEQHHLEFIVDIISCFVEENNKLLFSIFEDHVNFLDNMKFVKDRTVCINRLWKYNFKPPEGEIPLIRWYEASGKAEIIEAIKNDYQFNCIIVDSDYDITAPNYMLNSNEDIDFNSLSIREKVDGYFLRTALLKLQNLTENHLEIDDER